MSAWAEAAWIINQLKDRFDFEQSITQYQNAIAGSVSSVEGYYRQLLNTKEVQIVNTLPTIVEQINAICLIKGS